MVKRESPDDYGDGCEYGQREHRGQQRERRAVVRVAAAVGFGGDVLRDGDARGERGFYVWSRVGGAVINSKAARYLRVQ